MFISSIHIYPIKSLGGLSVSSAKITARGLEHDRRWMLIDENNRFLSQREFHSLALLQLSISENALIVSHKVLPIKSLAISFLENTVDLPRLQVSVWDDTVEAVEVSQEANDWFTEVLQSPTRLVYMPDDSFRKVDEKYAINQDDITSFSDGYPILIIGENSLADLNARLEVPVPMNRFRPNLVFSGGEPFEEDTWRNFSVGTSQLVGVKPCARCIMTTINQDSAETGKEPLKTLASFRKVGHKILFGQNVLPLGLGEISVGDEVVRN
jgi:uncharacterized protein